MKVYYFTATGNSLWVTKGITDNMESIAQIDFSNGYTAKDEEAVGIVCPTYGFTAPQIVQNFIKNTTFDTPYLFVIGTYGDRYGKFPQVIRKLFDGKKTPDYINSIKMVDNAVHAGYEMKNQIETLPEKKVEEHFEAIKQDIANKRHYIEDNANPVLSAMVYAAEPVTKKMRGNKVLYVDEACVKCGICTKVCPRSNITLSDHIEIGSQCELCLACVHNCPKHALHINHEKSTERYRNSAISLNEIIVANHQS